MWDLGADIGRLTECPQNRTLVIQRLALPVPASHYVANRMPTHFCCIFMFSKIGCECVLTVFKSERAPSKCIWGRTKNLVTGVEKDKQRVDQIYSTKTTALEYSLSTSFYNFLVPTLASTVELSKQDPRIQTVIFLLIYNQLSREKWHYSDWPTAVS